jgi:hypothetical protein
LSQSYIMRRSIESDDEYFLFGHELESKEMYATLDQQDDEVNMGVRLNMDEVGRPMILGLDKPFPLILTNKIEDSLMLTYVEGVFKAFNLDTAMVHDFYKAKAKRQVPYKYGVMVPYFKLDTSLI